MPRRRQHQATDAAQAASEAARVLQQRAQEVKQDEPVEKVPQSEEVSKDWVPPKRDDTHKRMMEEILSTRPNAEPKKEEPDTPQEEVKAEEPKAEEAPAEVPAEAPAVEMVKVKIDGEEQEVEKDIVEAHGGVRAYQIHMAAENRLKKSNEVLAENRKFQAAMLQMLQQMQEAQKPKAPEVTDDQFIASKLDQIRFGTPEEGAKAWLEIQQRQSKPVDPQAIIEQATNKFNHDMAVREFDKEFSDVVSNPMLLKLVVAERNEQIPQLRGPVDWHKFYRDIGNKVRSVIGKPTSGLMTTSTASGTPSQQSEKEVRKAAVAVNLPSSAVRAAPPKEEKPETRDDILRDMRVKRGLPVD